jgi:hypothetical protein
MAWLDDFLQLQPETGMTTRLEQERLFVWQLWASAYRAGAVAGFSAPGDPDPVELANDTLKGLRAYALEQRRPQQVSVLDNARGAEGWRLSYYAGWNAALNTVMAGTAASTQPRLLDTGIAEIRASQLLQQNQAQLLPMVEAHVGRSRLPDIARAASRFVQRASRAVRSSRFWPAQSRQTLQDDYDLEPPGADTIPQGPSDDASTRRGNVIPISSKRDTQSAQSRRATPRRASDWEPPEEAYPSRGPSSSYGAEAARAPYLSPAVQRTRPTVVPAPSRAPTKRKKPAKPTKVRAPAKATKPKRSVGRPKGSGKPVPPKKRTRRAS